MDYKESYIELLESHKRLEKELESFRSKNQEKSGIVREMIFKIFHSALYLMAISKLDTGQYVDVNETFHKSLGYSKEEIIGHTSDEIQIFADFEESTKYIKLISKLKSIKGYPVTLKTKTGEEKSYLFSADTVQLEDEIYLFTVFSEPYASKDRKIKESHGSLLDEIFETVSSYLALFSIDDTNRFYIVDLNKKVEEVEIISKSEVIGKFIDETPLKNRSKLIELLNHLHITGDAHKLAASPKGDDSEGYYMGFLLTSGNFVITWEPGIHQRNKDDLHKQGIVFEKFADLLPEMVYEVDLTGRILYANKHGMHFFGYTKNEIDNGVYISELFPDSYKEMIENLKALKTPGQISSNEYIALKKDKTPVPIVTHSFALYFENKIVGYRGVVTDISKQKEYENQIKREKAFLEHLYNSTPAAIAITSPS
ncbi:MAG TPA: PAS domain S-box protein, partial [Bacteroidales bacterium]